MEDEKTQVIKKLINKSGLGRAKGKSSSDDEIEQLKTKLDECNLPEETQKIVDQEIKKVESLDSRNQEYHVSLNYLTTISNLPWNKS
jgi:ATP-dependent Lon protease